MSNVNNEPMVVIRTTDGITDSIWRGWVVPENGQLTAYAADIPGAFQFFPRQIRLKSSYLEKIEDEQLDFDVFCYRALVHVPRC